MALGEEEWGVSKSQTARGSQLKFYLEEMNNSVHWGSYMLTSASPCLWLFLAA